MTMTRSASFISLLALLLGALTACPTLLGASAGYDRRPRA